jgi:hypothetical protein
VFLSEIKENSTALYVSADPPSVETGLVSFQVLTAASLKMTILRRVVSLKQTGVTEVHTASIIRTINKQRARNQVEIQELVGGDGGVPLKVGLLQLHYTALHPRRLSSSMDHLL